MRFASTRMGLIKKSYCLQCWFLENLVNKAANGEGYDDDLLTNLALLGILILIDLGDTFPLFVI